MRWDTARFAPDRLDTVRERFVVMVRDDLVPAALRAFQLAASERAHDEKGKASAVDKMAHAIRKQALLSENEHGVNNGLKRAATHHEMRVSDEALDAQPHLLNVANGTLNLEALELRPHDPNDLLTKITAASYRPDADAPEFQKFVDYFLPDPEVRAYVQRTLGAALLGHHQEIVLYFYGVGANGKSTLMRAAREALGDYGVELNADVFIARKGRASVADREQIAVLQGARLAITDEIDQGNLLAEAQLKWLTAPASSSQRKYGHEFTFQNQASIVISANHLFDVRGTDDGTWRRWALVPFDVQLPSASAILSTLSAPWHPSLMGSWLG
jgi:putative DNA primase/helicase